MRYAILYDFAVAYKVLLSIVVLAIWLYHHQWLDFGLVLVSTAMMLVAEMFNTTVEALCDFVETKQNEKIRVFKDIAAAAAGITILVWVAILIIEIIRL